MNAPSHSHAHASPETSPATHKTYHMDICPRTVACAKCFFSTRVVIPGQLRWTTRGDDIEHSYHLACVSQEMCQEMMIAHSGGERGLAGRRADALRFIDYWQCVTQIRGFSAINDAALKHGIGFYLARLARGCTKGISRHMAWVAPRAGGVDASALRRALRMAGPKSSLELIFDNELASWGRMMEYEDERAAKARAKARAKALRVEVNHLKLSDDTTSASPGPTSPGTPGGNKRRRSMSDESCREHVQW